jgi:hypothetical protein
LQLLINDDILYKNVGNFDSPFMDMLGYKLSKLQSNLFPLL